MYGWVLPKPATSVALERITEVPRARKRLWGLCGVVGMSERKEGTVPANCHRDPPRTGRTRAGAQGWSKSNSWVRHGLPGMRILGQGPPVSWGEGGGRDWGVLGKREPGVRADD